MWNLCPKCNIYRADKVINKKGTQATCPECGYVCPFKRLPLFVVTGPSGSGKSTIAMHLSQIQEEFVVIESDIFWRAEFDNPQDNFMEYQEFTLRAAKNISQANRPVLLCGGAIPSELDKCTERRYFSKIFCLGLICDETLLEKRLDSRPKDRNCGSSDFIAYQNQYSKYLRELGSEKQIDILDTSNLSVTSTVVEVLDWAKLSLSRFRRKTIN